MSVGPISSEGHQIQVKLFAKKMKKKTYSCVYKFFLCLQAVKYHLLSTLFHLFGLQYVYA